MIGLEKFNVKSEVEEYGNAIRIITNSDVMLETKNGILLDERELDLYKGLHAVEAVTEAQELVDVRMNFPEDIETKFNLTSDLVIMTFEEFKRLTK